MDNVSLPALVGSNDGFASAVASGAVSLLVGAPLKFRKGSWIYGREEGDLSGRRLLAYATTRAFKKWQDRKLVNQIAQVLGERFPVSAECIEDDGLPGQWQSVAVLSLRAPATAASYTFFSSSGGGRRAV